ncbi:MAG: hypothetical protein WC899_06615 [bacterium]|jgi:hypothetical protein
MGDVFRRLSRRYVRVSLFYLCLGLLVGAGMLWFGNDNFQFFHSHTLLVGTGLFAAYGAGFRWIASKADAGPLPGVSTAAANVQFWLANVGLPWMLIGSVLPIGLGLDRIGVLFGFIEAAAGVLFVFLLNRAIKVKATAEQGRS